MMKSTMPVRFDWDLLDPAGGGGGVPDDLESCFDAVVGDKRCLDHLLLHPDSDDAEFYTNPAGISPIPLPNDDIWKKFDIFDAADVADPDEELSDAFEDLTWMQSPMHSKDAREIRNHDCMWAGHCVSEKHDRRSAKKPPQQQQHRQSSPLPLPQPPPQQQQHHDAVTKPASPSARSSCGARRSIVAPTHARSLLLPTRIVTAAVAKKAAVIAPATIRLRSKTLDSGGESPRPETPQSLSDNEDLNLDLPDIKVAEDLVADAFGYGFANELAGGGFATAETNTDESSDDFGGLYMFERIQQQQQPPPPPPPSSQTHHHHQQDGKSKVNRTIEAVPAEQRQYATHSFFSDHCYHLSKYARMDNLGVQTPSDSEEEIDVETVYGDSKKPNSRSSSSSGALLPTNPSLSDRQQLQLTVASAISKKDARKQSARATSAGQVLDDRTLTAKTAPSKRKINVKSELRRTGPGGGGGGGGGGCKRGAHFDECGDFAAGKSVKRRKYQRHYKTGKMKKGRSRKGGGAAALGGMRSLAGGGSSDSEVDSMERRTIHNSMERQRRIDLRNAFEELRKLIPNTAGNEKAAKVVILNYGAQFCKSLTLEDSRLTRKRAELRRQQEMLMARVSQLRRSLAAQR